MYHVHIEEKKNVLAVLVGNERYYTILWQNKVVWAIPLLHCPKKTYGGSPTPLQWVGVKGLDQLIVSPKLK